MIGNITVTGQLIILSPNLIIFTYPLGDLSLAAGLLRSMEFITYLFCQKKIIPMFSESLTLAAINSKYCSVVLSH